MFERKVIDSAIEEGVIILSSRVARLALNELPLEIALDDIPGIPDEFRYLLKEVSKDTKVSFSEWVIQKDNLVFEPFRPLLDDLQKAFAETP